MKSASVDEWNAFVYSECFSRVLVIEGWLDHHNHIFPAQVTRLLIATASETQCKFPSLGFSPDIHGLAFTWFNRGPGEMKSSAHQYLFNPTLVEKTSVPLDVSVVAVSPGEFKLLPNPLYLWVQLWSSRVSLERVGRIYHTVPRDTASADKLMVWALVGIRFEQFKP